ncbi:MAG: Gfo/Idh/MocA family protein [Fibrobacterota bacterium]
MPEVRIALVGIGGYGEFYLQQIDSVEKSTEYKLTAAAEYNTDVREKISLKYGFAERGVRLFEDYESMLAEGQNLFDIVILSVGTGLHEAYSAMAMKRGIPVLCEKPPAAVIQEVDSMTKCSDETGVLCNIGFQSQFQPFVKNLQRLLCEGEIGRVTDISFMGVWTRYRSYYTRNAWAGKIRAGSKWVLDGPIANPMAHQLMNSLYYASLDAGKTAVPVSVEAEMYHGHDIEGEDTSCLRVITENDVRINFFTTLCGERNNEQHIEITGEDGSVTLSSGLTNAEIYKKGKLSKLIEGAQMDQTLKITNTARAFLGKEKPDCPVSITRNFVLALNGAYESSGRVLNIPETEIEKTEFLHEDRYGDTIKDERTAVKGIEKIMSECFRRRVMFSEYGVPWAKASRKFNLNGYDFFNPDIN